MFQDRYFKRAENYTSVNEQEAKRITCHLRFYIKQYFAASFRKQNTKPEPVFLNDYRAQESILRHQLRQPM
jgi:hypothetical protein